MAETEKRTSSRVTVGAGGRALLLLGGAGLLAVCAAGLIYALLPRQGQVETALYSYDVTADASYRVRVPPSQLYEGQWLDAGGLYSSALAELVEITCRVEAQGDAPAGISGSYRADALLEGYQMSGEVRRPIYQKEFSLAKGELTALSDKSAGGEAVLRLPLEDYRRLAEEADKILGVSVSRDLSVTFRGSARISSEYGERDEAFSCAVTLPLPKSAAIFEIQKTDAVSQAGQITRTETEDLPVRSGLLFVFGALGAAGLGALLFALLATRRPTPQELERAQCARLKRRYGSRMVGLDTLPDHGGQPRVRVRDMEGLLSMAEEMHLPACYWADPQGLPRDGVCFVAAPRCVYEFRLPRPQEEDTPFVPETAAEGGNERGLKA